MEPTTHLPCTRRRFLGAAAAWPLGLLLAGCGRDAHTVGPIYQAAPLGGAGGAFYRLAVPPLHNPTKLLQRYGALADYLSARLQRAQIALEASNELGRASSRAW